MAQKHSAISIPIVRQEQKPVSTPSIAPKKKKKHPLQHLIAGGIAGFVESSCCHPLDTIKTRMQLRRQASISAAASHAALGHKSSVTPMGNSGVTVTASLGPIGTAQRIIKREGYFSLYKGLSAVYTGIIPKMAIRFLSYEIYSEKLSSIVPQSSAKAIPFFAGLGCGLTEAVMIVTPAEVCKIRLQSQYHSMVDPKQMTHRKYTNVLQTAVMIVKEEGISALYKGVLPTMLRQGINQAVNFSCYQFGKKKVIEWQEGRELMPWQHLLIGGISGAFGPMVNNPLDVVKTRMQRQVIHPGHEPKYKGIVQGCTVIAREEGMKSLWKGLTPRLMRIVPGQAITFMTYEAVSSHMSKMGIFPVQS